MVTRKRVAALSKEELIVFIQSIIVAKQQDEAFYVLDSGLVMDLFCTWTCNLPMVQPFYAIKCNPNLSFIREMVELGSIFYCSSFAEIEAVLSLGVSPDRIILANPCKVESQIKYAYSVGPSRLETSGAKFPFGAKFGALSEEVVPLLQATQATNLNIVGVSFHISCSGAIHFHAFDGAIATTKIVFEQAAQLCMPKMHILNIGGGFSAGPQFTKGASAVKNALQKYFPNDSNSNLTVIAEPGRFFAELPFTLGTSIIGKRVWHQYKEY
ncbi:Ornithine/DAP/Arg decarboxylase [Corchorus olitorius]|uniref:ornithine decarboxylase n=1 Tax=Corchorus olitorius TaxID=93759 RepID=A0A1R3I8L1_9ROSI|nr:Ornithine/DAP/Arg decarboxylase [Corchorus olitorius]